MLTTAPATTTDARKSGLDRLLSLCADVRPGEGALAVLMLVNIALLLVCYSLIKTVREPLILLGGGAEVRSYAAGAQALVLIGLVPLYSWLSSRVRRATLLVAVSLFFIACIELFAAAVAFRVPFVGVAFFVWVGIFNVSLIAQFWSFANDIYTKEAGTRLFAIIALGMTGGAPIGSFLAARLFRSGVAPETILHLAAVLLAGSVLIYRRINSRHERRNAEPAPVLAAGEGFRLVLGNRYLQLVAVLIVLLNIVNTTGEYLMARLLTAHAAELALANPAFDARAYIGAFSGDYQFWVNVAALLLQALVTSRLVKHTGLAGALLALPLVALGGYALVAAGIGFSALRWIKTAENATDYSVMNTARQLLWLPTSREEKYKAKQAIDTFFVRAGDVLSAAVVYVGASLLHLRVEQFAIANIVLTIVWLAIALRIARPQMQFPRLRLTPVARTAAGTAAVVAVLVSPAFAQEAASGTTVPQQAPLPQALPQTRDGVLASEQARKSTQLRPQAPDGLERRLQTVDRALRLMSAPVYPFVGSAMEGGGLTLGPGFRGRVGTTGGFDVHAGVSVNGYRTADATLLLPALSNRRLTVQLRANWIDAPEVPLFDLGNGSTPESQTDFALRQTTLGVTARLRATRFTYVGAALDWLATDSTPSAVSQLAAASPSYTRTRLFAEMDTRTAPGYTRRGGLYRIEGATYRQTDGDGYNFRRVDAEARHFIPLMRENWVIALRAQASTTSTSAGNQVPYFLMPELGGSHWLRGYPAWRFRDNNRLLFSGEYRWMAGSFVDMSLFVDAGRVAAQAGDLASGGFKKTYGVGMSLHTLASTLARIEYARTPEGSSVLLSFGPSF